MPVFPDSIAPPAPIAVDRSKRRMRKGTARWYWSTNLTGLTVVTQAQITASLDLTPHFYDAPGWVVEQKRNQFPDVQTGTVIEQPGSYSMAASSIELWDTVPETALRIALVAGTDGHVVRMPFGRVVGYRVEVWPATTMEHYDTQWNAQAEPMRFVVPFAITARPVKTAMLAA